MGSCFSNKEEKEEIKEVAVITRENQKKEPEKDEFRVILIGTGEMGKSTIRKQCELIYGEGYNDTMLKSYVASCRRNIIEVIQELCEKIREVYVAEQEDEEWTRLCDWADELDLNSKPETEIIGSFYRSNAVTNFLERDPKQNYHSYWLQRAERIWMDDYLPVKEDILRCRNRTTKLQHFHFKMPGANGAKLVLIDVGGQRNERKKWQYTFLADTSYEIDDEKWAISYCVSLIADTHSLWEDEETNALDDSLEVFKTVLEDPAFGRVQHFFVVFTRKDVLDSKVRGVPAYEVRGYSTFVFDRASVPPLSTGPSRRVSKSVYGSASARSSLTSIHDSTVEISHQPKKKESAATQAQIADYTQKFQAVFQSSRSSVKQIHFLAINALNPKKVNLLIMKIKEQVLANALANSSM